jgi:hypothetical protein
MFNKKFIMKKAAKDAEKGDTKVHEKGETKSEKFAEGDIGSKYKNLKKK